MEVAGYVRAYRAALDWLYDPSNKAEALAILRKNLPAMTPELAERSYGILVDRRQGFSPKAEIDLAGVRTVLELRSRYGEPRKVLSDPTKYIDLSPSNAAGR